MSIKKFVCFYTIAKIHIHIKWITSLLVYLAAVSSNFQLNAFTSSSALNKPEHFVLSVNLQLLL